MLQTHNPTPPLTHLPSPALPPKDDTACEDAPLIFKLQTHNLLRGYAVLQLSGGAITASAAEMRAQEDWLRVLGRSLAEPYRLGDADGAMGLGLVHGYLKTEVRSGRCALDWVKCLLGGGGPCLGTLVVPGRVLSTVCT